MNLNQHFASISFAASGNLLLAVSRNSPYLCLYGCAASGNTTSTSSIKSSSNANYNYNLLYRYTLTSNASLSGLKVELNSKLTMVDGDAW